MLSHKHSFRLIAGDEPNKKVEQKAGQASVGDVGKSVNDEKRRLFLKTVGIIGAGAVGASMLPKRADALVMGGTPATSVVGLKNDANLRINPATETTLALIQAKTDNIPAKGQALADASTPVVLPVAQITALTPPAAITGFATAVKQSDGSQKTSIVDSTGSTISPVGDDSILYLRRMVKLMESNATVDAGNRQRVSIDAVGTGVSLAVTSTITLATIAGQNQQMYQDVARNAYANGIRANLTWS
jgi:hypothetical protein